MTEPTQALALPANIEAAFNKLDLITTAAVGIFDAPVGMASFARDLKLASAISQMRQVLSPEIMQPIMDLMNSDLGFKTDRDPARPVWNKEKKAYDRPIPYAVETVRECFIAAALRGLRPVGNEWNIISSQCYATKNGLKARLDHHPDLTNLKVNFGVPQMRESGAIVKVSATWNKGGVPDKIEAEIPVRINAQMGADAVLGKAERKIYKRILDRLTGTSMPEGDASETVTEVESSFTPAGPKPSPKFEGPLPTSGGMPTAVTPQPAPAQEPADDPGDDNLPWDRPSDDPADKNAPTTVLAQPQAIVEPTPSAPKPVQVPTPPPPAPPAKQMLTNEVLSTVNAMRDMATMAEVRENQLVGWMIYMKMAPPHVKSLEEVPHSQLLKLKGKWNQMVMRIKEYSV